MIKKRKMVLDEEEQALEAGILRGEWLRLTGKELAQTWARVNIRMSEQDVSALKKVASREGIGYQTLMSSVIHRFVTGQLVDRSVLEELKDMLRKPAF